VGNRIAAAGLVAFAASLALLAGHSRAAPAPDRVAVVARGLNNPRGLAIGPSGAVYVAEAGTAGRCVGPEREQVCFGFSGSVTRIRGSSVHRVSRGLLSIGEKDGSFTVGVDDVAVDRKGRLFAIMTSAPVPDPEAIVGKRGAAQLGKLLRLSVRKTVVADVGAVEVRQNPDGADVNPNPYSLALAADRIVVVDAGGNTLLSALTDGRVSVLAVFPARRVGKARVQSVPTTVAVGPDGAYYVGELGGDGTPRGAARVWRVVPGRKPTVFATGFDTITAVDFGPDGSLYVGELLRGGFGQLDRDDLTGSVTRIAPDGRRTELARGRLPAVGGLAVAPDGAVYVSTNSVLPRAGQVVRITRAS
jgi:hypothetical protein